MAISEHYAQIRRKLGAALLLVPGVAAIIRDETGRVLFQKKRDGIWSLPAGAIEPGENPAQAIVREVQEETGLKVKPERIVGIFGGDGFRYQYPNGDQVEYTVVLFECLKEGSGEQFDNEETQHLAYFAPEAPPPLGLAYPASIFSAPVFRPTSSGLTDEASAKGKNCRPLRCSIHQQEPDVRKQDQRIARTSLKVSTVKSCQLTTPPSALSVTGAGSSSEHGRFRSSESELPIRDPSKL